MDSRIDDLKAQLRRLEEQIAAGAPASPEMEATRARLERELVRLVVAAPATGPAAARPSRGLLAGLVGFVLVVAVAGYAWFGSLGALRQPGAADAASAAQATPQMQIGAMVAKLEERLKQTPEDAEGWTMLGRSYSVLGRYAEAVTAFKKVAALRPDDAQALADQADATAMAAGRKLAGEPEQLINQALKLDPKNLKALALAGTIAFDRGDFPTAVRHWEGAYAAAEPGSELATNLLNGVAEARKRGGLPAASAPAATATPAGSAPTAIGQVSGRVQLAATLKDRASPDDTLFVFARAVDGPRAPLAILRKQVKDLPLTFTLDDSMAMNPALRLSTAQQVVVGARISKSGNAIGQPGDLQGFSAPVRVGARGLTIEIGEVVK